MDTDKSADTVFVSLGKLGSGGFGIVDKVQLRSRLTLEEYAANFLPVSPDAPLLTNGSGKESTGLGHSRKFARLCSSSRMKFIT